MKKINLKKVLIKGMLLVFATETLAGCGSNKEANTSSTQTESGNQVSEAGTTNAEQTQSGMKMLVDLEKQKVAMEIPEGLYNETNLKTGDLESDDSILYYARYTAYRPNVDYSQATVSEMLFDIYIEAVDVGTDTVEYLDQVTVSLALQNADIARNDNETHGDAEYRVLTYIGTAKDGTAYTTHVRMTVLNGFFIMFRATEYTGSSQYVTYDDMADIYETIYDSVITQNSVL